MCRQFQNTENYVILIEGISDWEDGDDVSAFKRLFWRLWVGSDSF